MEGWVVDLMWVGFQLLFYVVLAFSALLFAAGLASLAANWQSIMKLFWRVHLAIGTMILLAVRDMVVEYLWPRDTSDRAMRITILCWLVFPVAMAFAIAWILPKPWKLLSLPSLMAVVFGYYRGFFSRPVLHKHWPRFVAEYDLMKTERSLSWLGLVLRLQVLRKLMGRRVRC